MSVSSAKSGPPPPFKITDSTQLDDWKKWQRSFRFYAKAISLEQKSHDVQLSTFKSLVGPDALEIYNTFSIVDITDVESVIRKFDDHFKPRVNLILERYKLYKLSQKSGQRFDDYLSDITNQVDKCEFLSMRDEIVLYKIVGGIENDDVRNALLADADLKYEKAVRICRASSISHFMSGKENVCKRAVIKKDEHGKQSYKELKKLLLDSTDKGQTIGFEKVDQKRRKPRKVASEGSTVEKSLQEDVVERRNTKEVKKVEPSLVKEIVDNSSSEENDGSEGGDSDGGDSDWRADDDYDDDYKPEPSNEIESKRQRSKETEQKKGEPSETLEKIESFICEVCGKAVTSKSGLKRHMMTHVQGKVTCHHCGGRYKQKRYLLRHIVRSHPGIIDAVAPKIFICDECDYRTYLSANMRRHKYQHTEERPLACELCEYKCIVPHLLKSHMVNHHADKSESPPPRSMKSSATCEPCGKGFMSRQGLKVHSVVHTRERPFACTVCDYRAVQRSSLNTHMLTHSDEKLFVCTVCGHSYKLKVTLRQHMLTHTGEKPFSCEICGKKFAQRGHVNAHMLTHTGEKPHVCEICGHAWRTKGNLTAHMKVHEKQSGDPSQYTPPRKRRKKPQTASDESGHSEHPAADAIIQWSEQVSAINTSDYVPNLETPPPFHPTYPIHQGNPRPPDCRYYQQRQWPNQGYHPNQNQ